MSNKLPPNGSMFADRRKPTPAVDTSMGLATLRLQLSTQFLNTLIPLQGEHGDKVNEAITYADDLLVGLGMAQRAEG
jgi:hypothetical protein